MKKSNVKESSVISHFYVLVKPEPYNDLPVYFHAIDSEGNLGTAPILEYAYLFLMKREVKECLRYLEKYFPDDKFVPMEVMSKSNFTLPFECFLNK